MKRMSEAKPIFLRCIKPNASKKPNDFNEKFVLLQVIIFVPKFFNFLKLFESNLTLTKASILRCS